MNKGEYGRVDLPLDFLDDEGELEELVTRVNIGDAGTNSTWLAIFEWAKRHGMALAFEGDAASTSRRGYLTRSIKGDDGRKGVRRAALDGTVYPQTLILSKQDRASAAEFRITFPDRAT
ncbi:MAG: hypothetical protein ACREHV_11345 [Rhizomicrobium sp.]